MEKMPMCRICLVENVRMNIVSDKDLQKLYETLTDVPFVTDDRRPMFTCFLCFAKLKQCCQLQRKCLEAEELFAQMMNEPNSSVNRGQLKFSRGLIVTPVENISIVEVGHIESIAVKEELPAVRERLDDVNEPERTHFNYELKLERLSNSCSDEEDMSARQSELEDDVPFTRIETEVQEEQELSWQKRRASDTTREAVVKTEKLYVEGNKLEDVIIENEEWDTEVTQNSLRGSFEVIPKFEKSLTNTASLVTSSVDTTLDTDCRNNKNLNSIKDIHVHTGEKPFKCDICQSCFNQKDLSTNHTSTQTDNKCEQCQRCFFQTSHLASNLRKRTGEKRYKCEECQTRFSRKTYLTTHLRTHTGEKPYKCEVCQLCFSHKTTLVRHLRTHTGELPYKCEECELCFSQKGHLNRHFRTHTGEKPYKCDGCGISFTHKSTLTRHIRTHTGEQPFKCEECPLRFCNKSNLKTHIRTHSGEKPYKCEECDKSFSHKCTLTKHMRCRHASEKPNK